MRLQVVFVSCCFRFSITPTLPFPSFRFLFTLVLHCLGSASVQLLFFTLPVVICLSLFLFSLFTPSYLHLFHFSTEMRGYVVCFLVHHMVVFRLDLFLPMLFRYFLSLFSPSLFQVFCVRMKRSLLSAICCLRSESFSSGSLLHAASLTAWVKRTDPPCIANVLQGNQLNYAHCGGEDIHNAGIKLLKVTQYLALQLPAVYRR